MDPAIPMAQFFRLLEQAARETENPDLGLDYYRDADWADLGLFGFAAMHTETIADSLVLMCRYDQMVQSHSRFTLSNLPDGTLAYEYCILDRSVPGSRYDNDLSLSGLVYSIRSLSGRPDWRPMEAQFMHPAPADLAGYAHLLGDCPLVFDAPVNRLLIDSSIADAPVLGRDPRLFTILESELKRLSSTPDLKSTVMDAVRFEVANELPRGVPGIDSVADRMAMSRRSLQRRLTECGVTYKQLVEQIREELARHYLSNTAGTLLDIALLLGYSELSAFIRAFRRWTGQTPQQYRNSAALV